MCIEVRAGFAQARTCAQRISASLTLSHPHTVPRASVTIRNHSREISAVMLLFNFHQSFRWRPARERVQATRAAALKLAATFALLLFSVSLAAAQSGRRLPNSKPAAPVPTPEPAPTPKPREEKKPSFTMIVGIDRGFGYETFSLSLYSTALHAVADRLDHSAAVKVETAQRDMSRGDAIKKAKSEKTGHVVWLQLKTDSLGADASSQTNELILEYVVFAPQTAKIVTSGRTYQGQSKRGVILPPTRTNNLYYLEYLVKLAGEAAAERILNALHLPEGREIPGLGRL